MEAVYVDHMGDDLRVAYIAGLIDADGCVAINKVDEGRYAPCLSFVNTSLDLVYLIQDRFGGNIQQKKKVSKNHADVFELQIRDSKELAHALHILIPFLRYKKKKAELAKEYVWSIMDNKKKKLSVETKETRKEILHRWRLLT